MTRMLMVVAPEYRQMYCHIAVHSGPFRSCRVRWIGDDGASVKRS